MYAKLVFPGDTKTGEQIRDIVRLITSSTSGTASLSGLEFIDTANSTVAGGNTGWSLHSSSPSIPSSGAAVSAADSNFTLEAPCVTGGKTKYCSIHVNASWTHAAATHTGDDFAFTLSSVVDPGTSTELYSNGYTSTDSARGDCNGICGNVEHSDGGVHIFADNRRIILFGKDGNNHTILMMNGEFAETDTTTRYSLVPHAQIHLNDMAFTTASQAISYRGDGNAWWDDQTIGVSWISFLDAMYSYNLAFNGKIRYTGWHHRNSDRGKYRMHSRLDDGTTLGSTTNYSTVGYGASDVYEMIDTPVPAMFGPNSLNQGWNDNSVRDARFGRAGSNAVEYDSTGNPGLALYKMWWQSPNSWNSDRQMFSDLCNIWRCPAGLGSDGDTVTIGSDTYVYLNHSPNLPTTLGAFLIKRT